MTRHGDLFDLLIIGGGINGTGIACDAAGRGLRVALCEQGDLAQATSSASSKLIHGGLRYLEQYEFRLVREALKEREILLHKAPHIVRPLRFILPHDNGQRPRWLIRAGLFLYDRLAGRQRLAPSSAIDLRSDPTGQPLRPSLANGFAYSDCWVDDARLVVLNAVAAAEQGTQIMTRTRVTGARRVDGVWEARIETGGATRSVRARILINAAGPWVVDMLQRLVGAGPATPSTPRRVRLVKGSHLVVPKLYQGHHAYILQNDDGRVVFALPFERAFSLIGTTDVPVDGDPADARIDADEATYICDAVNRYFTAPIGPQDAIWSYAGVRALFDDDAADPSAVTRDYVLDLDAGKNRAPLLSVFGGKITTYRRLAEQALAKLRPFLSGIGQPWTRFAPLPGGDFPDGDFARLVGELSRAYAGFDRAWLELLARRHGSRSDRVLGDAKGPSDLGRHYGGGLYAREVDHLVNHEWAVSVDDILWRRTKCALHMTDAERVAFADRFSDAPAYATAGPDNR